MKCLLLNTKSLTFILFLILLLPSCNNEELFVVDESEIIAEQTEETEEDLPNDEDETPPIETVNDSVTTNENVPIEIRVHLNDNNLPTSGTISNTDPSNGSLSINDNDTSDDKTDDFIIYTPNTGFSGIDYFEYTVCNTATPPDCSTALVEITVNPNENIDTVLKAFPSAYGGGSNATGGRNGVLVIVNTLDKNVPLTYNSTYNIYTGGPSAALSENIGARYVVYNVSGNVDIGGGTIGTNRNDITVFGQSAPRGGITFYNGAFQIASSNIIVRYIRTRNGNATQSQMDGSGTTGSSGYGMVIRSSSNNFDDIMLDHVSASWGGDKAILLGINTEGVSQQRHTIQRCALSDSHTYLQLSTQRVANIPLHKQLSVIANLFARGQNRTPNIGGTDDYVDVINNVIQSKNGNKLGVIQWSDNAKFNWDRNYYQYIGSNQYGERNEMQWSGGGTNGGYNPTSKIFDEMEMHSRGNYYNKVGSASPLLSGTENIDKNDNALMWGWRNLAGGSGSSDYYQGSRVLADSYFVENEHNGIPNKPPRMSAFEAYASIIADGDVGACRYLKDDGTVDYYMDSWDSDLITNYKNKTMGSLHDVSDWILPNITTNSRPESYDTDFDGMSDDWERANFGGNLNQGYNDDFDNDGYTNIEEYYNQVDFK